jgi:hypothetical protein
VTGHNEDPLTGQHHAIPTGSVTPREAKHLAAKPGAGVLDVNSINDRFRDHHERMLAMARVDIILAIFVVVLVLAGVYMGVRIASLSADRDTLQARLNTEKIDRAASDTALTDAVCRSYVVQLGLQSAVDPDDYQGGQPAFNAGHASVRQAAIELGCIPR